jgi:quinol monooxygenase YgiN
VQPKFNLTATLHAKPEKRTALLELLSSFVGKSRSERGCVDYHFHVSLDDPNTFYFYENWAERSDFDRHIALDYQKDWFAKQGEYLAEPVKLSFFEMVSAYDKQTASNKGESTHASKRK